MFFSELHVCEFSDSWNIVFVVDVLNLHLYHTSLIRLYICLSTLPSTKFVVEKTSFAQILWVIEQLGWIKSFKHWWSILARPKRHFGCKKKNLAVLKVFIWEKLHHSRHYECLNLQCIKDMLNKYKSIIVTPLTRFIEIRPALTYDPSHSSQMNTSSNTTSHITSSVQIKTTEKENHTHSIYTNVAYFSSSSSSSYSNQSKKPSYLLPFNDNSTDFTNISGIHQINFHFWNRISTLNWISSH